MKTTLYLFLLSGFFFFLFSSLTAGSGGPDAYGYTWKDSNEPGGPVYGWYDVIGNGKEEQVFGLADDNVVGPFTIINNFNYYWYNVDKFWVGSNGYISFGSINIASPFPVIPNSTDGKHNFIAALLSDINFTGTGNQAKCYYLDMGDSLIISWIGVPFWQQAQPTFTGSNSFQIVLNKLDYSVTINYQNQTGLTQNDDISIGIENINGDIGLQHSKNVYPVSGYSIKFYYPSSPGPVTDVGARWNTAEGSRGIFVPYAGNPFQLATNVGNLGNQTIPVFTASATVKDYSGATVVSTSTTTADSLVGGKDTTLVFPNQFNPASTGIYTYTTTVSGITNDATSSNNSVTEEIVVVDTSLQTVTLSYTDDVFEGGLGWAGGGGGAGMFFIPPFYPAKITATNYFISVNSSNVSFYAKVYDDDGLNGAPGTLLDSVEVPAASMVIGAYTKVPLSAPVIINSGGFYVLWDMGGDGINIGTDSNAPFSLRSYEVLGGFWAEYRSNETADFGISADIESAVIEDVGTSSITSPASGAYLTAPTLVSCRIKNYGNLADGSFVANYNFNGGAIVSENYTGAAIPPGDSVDFNFSTPFFEINPVAGNVCVWTVNTNDFNLNNDTACIPVQFVVVGEAELTFSEYGLQVYPNPAKDKISFSQNFPGASIKISNILGENVYSGKFKRELDISFLPPGIYTVEAVYPQNVLRAKFVKE